MSLAVLNVYVGVAVVVGVFDVFPLEIGNVGVVDGYDEIAEYQYHKGYYRRTNDVRLYHLLETYAVAQNGDYFGMPSHLGGEIHHRNEHKQRTEQVYETRNEVEIILNYNKMQGCVVFKEVVQFLAHVEHYDNDNNQAYCQTEGGDKLAQNVFVYYL